MTVVITDTRTVVDEADSLTGWSSPVNSESLSLFSSNPTPIEASDCIGMAISEEVGDLIHTLASAVDLSDTLVYAWVLVNGDVASRTTGGMAIILRDATPDSVAFHVAGNDVAAFRHNEDGPNWQCLLIDTVTREGAGAVPFTDVSGNEPSLDRTNITDVGTYFDVASKALGGAENCFTDIIRYGTGGIVIAGGATGARGTFDEMATDDRSGGDGKAWGIIHEVASGVFGVQGPLTFGLVANDAEHWFQDTDVTVVFEDRGIELGRYFFDVVGNSTDTQHFQLGLISGLEFGTNGCNITVPVGVGASCDMSDADLDFVGLYDTVFTGFDGGILFCDDATNGITHDVFGCAFVLCGTINPGRVDMKNCTIVNASDATAMLLEDSDNTLMEKLNFFSDATGHALELTHTGAGPHAITLKGHTYTGYASSDGSTGNEVLLYNPGTTSADITITIAGDGETPTVMKAGGVTGIVTIVNNVDLKFSGLKDNTEVRVYAEGTTTELAGIENATVGTADDREVTFSLTGGLSVDIRFAQGQAADGLYYKVPPSDSILDFTWPTVTGELPITQVLDRNFSDPV